MFNPERNALYAAHFLIELHREFGSWTEAAGAYHSRTPEHADRYKAKFSDLRMQFDEFLPNRTDDPSRADVVQWGQSGSSRHGSLFLSDASVSRPFIALRKAK
jgi:hypothetical protein